MLVTFLLTAAVYFLLNKKYSLFNLMTFLSFLNFYGTALFIGSIYIWYLYKRDWKVLVRLIPGPLAAAAIVSPLLWQQYQNSRIALAQVQNWSLVLGKSNLKNLLLIPIKFSIGRISFEPKMFYWAVSAIWTALLALFTFKGSKSRKDFLFWIIGVLVLAFIISFSSPLLQYFRFLYLIPLISLLIALGANKNWQKKLLISGLTIFSLIYLLIPNFHREDWKSLVRDLPADKQIYMIASSSDPVKYYSPYATLKDLRQIENTKEKELLIIPYTADIHGYDYKSVLIKKGYQLEDTKNFRELKYEKWLKQALYYSEEVAAPLN